MAFMYKPEQHRQMAKRIRLLAGQPGAPRKERAEQMAINHEGIARMIERYLAE